MTEKRTFRRRAAKGEWRNIFLAVAVAVVALCVSLQPSLAKKPIVSTGGVAIQGYDTVAYFTDNAAVKGATEFGHKWKNVSWLFKSAEHRDMFAANPEKYAPQYGGHCSLSVANGRDSNGSAKAWHLHKGKLYLNYSKEVREKWLGDMEWYIKQADKEWPRLARQY